MAGFRYASIWLACQFPPRFSYVPRFSLTVFVRFLGSDGPKQDIDAKAQLLNRGESAGSEKNEKGKSEKRKKKKV